MVFGDEFLTFLLNFLRNAFQTALLNLLENILALVSKLLRLLATKIIKMVFMYMLNSKNAALEKLQNTSDAILAGQLLLLQELTNTKTQWLPSTTTGMKMKSLSLRQFPS